MPEVEHPSSCTPKADPRLEGDVAYDKADPLVCLPLNQISVLQYFFLNGWLYRPPRCALTGFFFIKSFCHSGCTFLANREGWRLAGDLVPQEAPDHS